MDKFARAQKITSQPNSDGLINCLRQPKTAFWSIRTSMREKFQSSINFTALGQFHLPGQRLWVVGPTRRCLVFCSLPGLFHRDPKRTILTRTWYRYTASP